MDCASSDSETKKSTSLRDSSTLSPLGVTSVTPLTELSDMDCEE